MRALGFVSLVLLVLAGCDGTPREGDVQSVARDLWDPTCAEQAMVETWTQSNGAWKIKGEVWKVDVTARFKLVNKCESGLPLVGRKYEQFAVVPFSGTVEMSKCKKGSDTGWAIPGKESSRCWTGPTLLGTK